MMSTDEMIAVIKAATNRILELETALRNCARNDKTTYSHHERRPWDGKKPSECDPPGSIFLTPREIAMDALDERDLARMVDKR